MRGSPVVFFYRSMARLTSFDLQSHAPVLDPVGTFFMSSAIASSSV